jgi:hypothetical protein
MYRNLPTLLSVRGNCTDRHLPTSGDLDNTVNIHGQCSSHPPVQSIYMDSAALTQQYSQYTWTVQLSPSSTVNIHGHCSSHPPVQSIYMDSVALTQQNTDHVSRCSHAVASWYRLRTAITLSRVTHVVKKLSHRNDDFEVAALYNSAVSCAEFDVSNRCTHAHIHADSRTRRLNATKPRAHRLPQS